MSTSPSPSRLHAINLLNTSGITTRSASRGDRNLRHNINKRNQQRQKRQLVTSPLPTSSANEAMSPKNRGEPSFQRRSTPRQRKTSSSLKVLETGMLSPSLSVSSRPRSTQRSSRNGRLPLSPLRMAINNPSNNVSIKAHVSQLKDNRKMEQRDKENFGTSSGGADRNSKSKPSFFHTSPEPKKNQLNSNGCRKSKENSITGTSDICDYESPLLVNFEKSASLSYSKISDGSRSGGTETVRGIAYASDNSANSDEEEEIGRRLLQFSNIKPKTHIFSPNTAPESNKKSPVTDRSKNEMLSLSHSTISNRCHDDVTPSSRKSLGATRSENESLNLSHSTILNDMHDERASVEHTIDTSFNGPTSCGKNKTSKRKSIQFANTMPKKKKRIFSQFEYPQNIQPPTADDIRMVYEEVMNESSLEVGDEALTTPIKTDKKIPHQMKLKLAGSNQISFEQVLIPCIIYRQREELAKIQGKAQGYGDDSTKEKVLLCRATLKAIERDATFAVKKCQEEHETEVRKRRKEEENRGRVAKQERKKDRIAKRQKRVEERKREVQKRRKEEEERKRKEIAEADRRVERRKRERKKSFPKNKELWREVALLMTDLARLEKEKTMWKNAGSILDEMEGKFKNIPNMMDTEKDEEDKVNVIVGNDESENDAVSLQKAHQTAINDITVTATRINNAIGEVKTLVEKADTVRRDLYTKYKTDHKFQGYLGIKNPKALIRALAL